MSAVVPRCGRSGTGRRRCARCSDVSRGTSISRSESLDHEVSVGRGWHSRASAREDCSMSTEGNDPKGRGRRLFGSRRRQAAPPERPPAVTPEAPPEDPPPVASEAPPEPPRPPAEPPSWRYTPVAATPPAAPAEPAAPSEAAAPVEPETKEAAAPTDEETWTVETGANGQAQDGTPPAPPTPPAFPGRRRRRSAPPEPEAAVVEDALSGALAPAEGGHVEPPASRRPRPAPAPATSGSPVPRSARVRSTRPRPTVARPTTSRRPTSCPGSSRSRTRRVGWARRPPR